MRKLRSFLGMINYLNRYSGVSAHFAVPLSALTHQAINYKPGKVHSENFNRLKMENSSMKALPYFDVNAETTLQMDASKKGLGVCLIQKGKVICYASRALTKTEQNYQNLEQEALGTIWGMEKFHYFLYGKEFTLETDQKPLVSIYKKHLIDISPRVQRLIVRSFPHLPFKVVYNKRNTHSSCRCTQSCDLHRSGRQHPVANHSSQHDHHTDSNECRISG